MKPAVPLLVLTLFLPLIAASASPRHKNDAKLNDALWDAVWDGNAARAKALLNQGSQVDNRDERGFTPLIEGRW